MRGKAWDLNESKIQAVSAELTTRVQALFTNELKSTDTSVRRYVGELEYQNEELSKKIERLENEMLSLKASLTSMTERTEIKTNRPTPKEQRFSTPMATPMYKSDEDWTHHPFK
jgi:predicted RNase H-like nuclease (RuvC/YqgF family)